MGGSHHSHVTATGRHRKRLMAALAITLGVVGVQLVGGLLSGSLALLADAGHMLADALGVTIALVASTLAMRPATRARTFGLLRAEILAALANALLLGALAVWILVEAARRWNEPPEVATGVMLIAAAVGALANLASLLLLREGSRESLNMRGAYLEVLGDLVGSVAVIAAGLVILFTGYARADVIASIGIGLFILPRAWRLGRQAVEVLLEAVPHGMDLDRIRDHIAEIPGVIEVHDLHVWTITSGMPALSAHVVVDDALLDRAGTGQVLDALADCLGEHFDTEHCTFQLEPAGRGGHEWGHR